jgi:hypothetical protein
MAPARLMVGAVLFANEETLLMADRTLFVAPAGMCLPHTTLVIEYEIIEWRNVLAQVPKVRV